MYTLVFIFPSQIRFFANEKYLKYEVLLYQRHIFFFQLHRELHTHTITLIKSTPLCVLYVININVYPSLRVLHKCILYIHSAQEMNELFLVNLFGYSGHFSEGNFGFFCKYYFWYRRITSFLFVRNMNVGWDSIYEYFW